MTANIFRSQRLVYRAVEDSPEEEAFLHRITTDIEGFANSNVGLSKPQNKESTKGWRKYLTEKTLISAIFCVTSLTDPESTPEPIGVVTLTGTSPHNAHHRNANISVDVLPSHQRKGYGSEAIQWVLQWGFQMAGLHRIGIESFEYNEGAGRLYERLGFTLEGRKRDYLWFNGEWHDMLGFSMLEDEWRELQKVQKTD
ncbi:putative gnat family protein [Phaeoacremonium minimum UCRPA7]|uniref:Putative gnat family protein n=1 Tax=Phaeoacremonium minimum (strain UCR-PA7) TaxID=1286976 RepID=R8BEK4_PHAM7|nr:putative gnat family protein [Phaeoacremonium minimum UCRPA7]EON97731.1 putative gnat family protein [Phaeoacremonium minimum UCRPA7]